MINVGFCIANFTDIKKRANMTIFSLLDTRDTFEWVSEESSAPVLIDKEVKSEKLY